MNLALTYYPNKGFSLGGINFNWGDERLNVRQQLNNKHFVSDSIIDFSKYNNGKSDFNIIQRRDIYKNYDEQGNYFFLNYDKNDFLRDIEIHNGIDFLIENIKFNFDLDVIEIVSLCNNISRNIIELDKGEYLFKDLKMTISDSESMGGDGNLLSYIYCAKNIEHII